MEIVQTIVAIAGYVATFVMALASIFAKKKDKGKRKVLEYDNAVREVLDKVPEFVVEAEKIFGAGNGTAKLIFVKTRLQCEAISRGVVIDEDTLVDEIEKILATPQKKEN